MGRHTDLCRQKASQLTVNGFGVASYIPFTPTPFTNAYSIMPTMAINTSKFCNEKSSDQAMMRQLDNHPKEREDLEPNTSNHLFHTTSH